MYFNADETELDRGKEAEDVGEKENDQWRDWRRGKLDSREQAQDWS